MDDSSSIRVQRRIELYGPNRCLARQAAKEKLIEDHVKKNLQNAADQVHSNHTFQTTTAKDFEVSSKIIASYLIESIISPSLCSY